MTFLNTHIEHELSEEVRKWLEEEITEQDERYGKIVAEMEALSGTRDQWYDEFLERIQKYGFNADGDRRVKIASEDVPVQPDGKHKVVY